MPARRVEFRSRDPLTPVRKPGARWRPVSEMPWQQPCQPTSLRAFTAPQAISPKPSSQPASIGEPVVYCSMPTR